MSALGLGDYGSSDEEDDVAAAAPVETKAADDQVKIPEPLVTNSEGKEPAHNVQPDSNNAGAGASAIDTTITTPIGPTLGPAPGPAPMPSDLPGLPDTLAEDDGQPPASPYTINRSLIRSLTMPPIPVFDIPASPPGSPPAATTAKFDRFLELKKKGVHFNERLHQSSALRNPGLLGKLMDFAGISQEDQYASAIPEGLAVPTKFPEWAYADKLVKEHERIAKKREDERAKLQREAINFVPAKRAEGDKAEPRRSRFDEGDRRDGNRHGDPSRGDGRDDRDRRDRRRSRSPR